MVTMHFSKSGPGWICPFSVLDTFGENTHRTSLEIIQQVLLLNLIY